VFVGEIAFADGGAGNDIFRAQYGTQWLGRSGDDLFNLTAPITAAFGGGGQDTFIITDDFRDPGVRASAIYGGPGRDRLELGNSLVSLVSPFTRADSLLQYTDGRFVAETVRAVGFEVIATDRGGSDRLAIMYGTYDLDLGSAGDLVYVHTDANTIQLSGGRDGGEVYGRDNIIFGGDGSDSLRSFADTGSNNQLWGGDQIDRFELYGDAIAYGGAGKDRFFVHSIADVFGGEDGDIINVLASAFGAVIQSGQGDDEVIVSGHASLIATGAGADRVVIEPTAWDASITVSLGAGADRLVVNGTTRFNIIITDFNPEKDRFVSERSLGDWAQVTQEANGVVFEDTAEDPSRSGDTLQRLTFVGLTLDDFDGLL